MDINGTGTDIVTDSTRVHPSSAPPRCLLWFVAIALATVGTGCGSSEPEITPTTVDGDRILFERGADALAENSWIAARDYFVQVRDNYPQSDLRADARLGIADSFGGQGNTASYVSALAEYQDFLSLYPTHPRAAYAQFKLAMVHHQQMRPPERDQAWTRSAILQFELFIERYPDSELVGDARGYIREARDRLSESNFLIGRYYYRNKWWPGAVDRLREVLDSDPQFAGREPVYFYLASAFYNSLELEEALTMFQRLIEDFPETEFVQDATEAVADIETQLAANPAESPEPDEANDDDSATAPAPSFP